MQASYAFSATVFFTVFLASLIIYGGETARYLATFAAFIGAWSQFVAQDSRPAAKRASIALAYVAMGLGVAALVVWK